MKLIDHSEALRLVARGAGKPAAFISINTDLAALGGDHARWRAETLKATPWLDGHEYSCQVLVDGVGYVVLPRKPRWRAFSPRPRATTPTT